MSIRGVFEPHKSLVDGSAEDPILLAKDHQQQDVMIIIHLTVLHYNKVHYHVRKHDEVLLRMMVDR